MKTRDDFDQEQGTVTHLNGDEADNTLPDWQNNGDFVASDEEVWVQWDGKDAEWVDTEDLKRVR